MAVLQGRRKKKHRWWAPHHDTLPFFFPAHQSLYADYGLIMAHCLPSSAHSLAVVLEERQNIRLTSGLI